MAQRAVRDRTRRPRWRGPLVVVTVTSCALVALLISRPDVQERGFRLDDGITAPAASTDALPPLEHPVPDDLQPQRPSDGAVPAALRSSPWLVPDYLVAETWLLRADTVWRPTSPYSMLDLASEHITVVDGGRRTWTPPPCDCPTVRVWMYGGSTTWGIHQRDEHTIASELARVAHDDGLRLEVDNRGSLSYLHWLEAQRFALDLTVDPAPDLVLFYDGVNETWATNQLSARRSGDVRFPVDAQATDVWEATGRTEGAPPNPPPVSQVLGWDRGVDLAIDDLARLTVERYDRSRAISRAAADRHGVATAYVWQPSRVSRDLHPDEPHGDAEEERSARRRDQLQQELLPDDVIDLVDAFDDRTEPLFTDDVHHNEEGARIIAEAIYARIEPDLRRIAAQRGGGR